VPGAIAQNKLGLRDDDRGDIGLKNNAADVNSRYYLSGQYVG